MTNETTNNINGTQNSNASAIQNQIKRTTTQELGRDEFLKMLVAQLQNQDPLDPMKGEEFAVNLAQFSQLEQLIEINEKLGADAGSGDISSYASFLGQEVTINSNEVVVSNGDGGSAAFTLVNPSSEVKIELLNTLGEVKKSITAQDLEAGHQNVALRDLDLAPGTYTLRVSAKGASGQFEEIEAKAAGIVSGFIPGADPVLLIGNREVKSADVLRVNAAA